MRTSVWRSRWWSWALPVAFCVANAVFLAAHPARTGTAFVAMQEDLEAETAALAELGSKRDALAELRRVADRNRAGMTELYQTRFSTQADRLVALLSEVKGLARRAGLEPPRLTYPEEVIDEFGLVRKGIDFQVVGSYGQFRNFLNLLELSDYFLVLETVRLRGSEGSTLAIDLRLSTFFVAVPGEAAGPRVSDAEGGS
ncbi:MAG: hypothetical protein R3190_02875 [Thermoanaerobaculia bacterium]|nr:hypothetical protein [Thermoanaerobaculia bacterium]